LKSIKINLEASLEKQTRYLKTKKTTEMKSKVLTTLFSIGSLFAVAQSDSSYTKTDSILVKQDTVKVGNFYIVKKNAENGNVILNARNQTGSIQIGNVTIKANDLDRNPVIKIERKKPAPKKISTNWWILDLGFAGKRDETNYTTAVVNNNYLRTFGAANGAPNNQTFNVNNGKTTNVNLWFFMQKVSIVKQAVFLKYGMGMEMYNFRYDSRVSYRKESFPYLYNDSISFSKNKLFAGYLSVPLMLHINTTPGNKKGFSFSAGVSAGYLVGSRVKQKSEERGKQKYKGDFDLSPFRTALIGELGIGPVKLYGSYSLNTLHDSYTRLEQYPFALGIRFSNW
jgi:hypothetical protein